jgi:RNA polymerase sigma-70 factor (ECF subfamily)
LSEIPRSHGSQRIENLSSSHSTLSDDERELLEATSGTNNVVVPTPEDVLISRADLASLNAAIADLSEEFREVLVLRDLQGLDYREISEITGAPLGTVMSRLTRARQRLIRKLTVQEEK